MKFHIFLLNGMLHMKLKVLCHLMNTYNWLTQNLLGGLRRSREVLEPEERSLVLQVLLNLFRNVISSYLYNCQKNNQINKSSFVSLADSVVKIFQFVLFYELS